MVVVFTRRSGVMYTTLASDEADALERVRQFGEESLLVWELQPAYVLGANRDLDTRQDVEPDLLRRVRHTRLEDRASYDAPVYQSIRAGGDMWMGPGVLRATVVMDLAARQVRARDHRDALLRVVQETCGAFSVSNVRLDTSTCIFYGGTARLGIVMPVITDGKITKSGIALYVTGEVGQHASVLDAEAGERSVYTSLADLSRGRTPTMNQVVTEFVAAFEREIDAVIEDDQ